MFNSLTRYAPYIVRTMRARVHRYVDGLEDHLIRECRVASLSDVVDITGPVSLASLGNNGTGRAGDTASPRASIGAREAGTRGTEDSICASKGNLSL
ncbi:hypothetical protein RDI58_017577 [Solanum bulbocastanum]|uniref:Uncharacterized protein n=1 Tax=Solanum bulbocastanum TaxID=147425 RepID=A0AAN8YC51_SOLBU